MKRNSLAALSVCCFALVSACKRDVSPPAPPAVKTAPVVDAWIARTLERLQSPDETTRRDALDELKKKGRISLAEGLELLRATTLTFPAGTEGLWDTPAWILALLTEEPRVEYVPLVKEVFPRLSVPARERALDLLSEIDDLEAARTFMQLLIEHSEGLTALPVRGLQDRPHHADVFFPDLLAFADKPQFADDVYLTMLVFCEKGLLPPAKLAGHTAPLLAAWRAERDWLAPRQAQKGLGWIWEEDYQAHRTRASLLLDLFGYVPMEDVEPELRGALKFRDPRLVYFTVTSLLEQGREVPAAAVEQVAASPEMRLWLHKKLEERHQLALFPKRFLTQPALAEAVMVQWLVYPTELGRVPDEIVMAKVVPADTGGPDGVLDTYVFKFRTFPPHWAAKDGWMAGVAGPFLRKDAPSTVAYGGTFSKFESWTSKTPEAHVGDIEQILKEWADYRAKEGQQP